MTEACGRLFPDLVPVETHLRAKRRAAKDKFKAIARKLFKGCKHPEKYADNRTPCSRPGCCGNRRRYAKSWDAITIRERRVLMGGGA